MSTKLYPLYQLGNPRTRVFLPDFWMKLVASVRDQPKHIVTFHVHPRMSKLDAKNYLEKIYGVKVANIHKRIIAGEYKKHPFYGHVTERKDETKVFFIHLADEQTFEFPDIFPEDKKSSSEDQIKQYSEIQKQARKDQNVQWKEYRPGVPSWFSL
ncbi:PREDICTED: 39S ribosomal protein L23, mitochondrial-like [Priapulus caudatus]|uniref:Large ribosomal subunit protein uL23m n=1 Tax=Priapulus caudatus TaxID=37621 RepID=A0ABM1FAC0_PRICU|nr:PREDICTED: 39S ribosomal protein L23, mitochondrial-like [Priapulus caudatus]